MISHAQHVASRSEETIKCRREIPHGISFGENAFDPWHTVDEYRRPASRSVCDEYLEDFSGLDLAAAHVASIGNFSDEVRIERDCICYGFVSLMSSSCVKVQLTKYLLSHKCLTCDRRQVGVVIHDVDVAVSVQMSCEGCRSCPSKRLKCSDRCFKGSLD